ncbi:MAG: PIN domain-containing protein [Solirubrobacterales bacterium]
MPFRAVLDTNVLFPFSLRDTLWRLAEPAPTPSPAPLYIPLWSERILNEMVRNLVEDGRMDQDRADRLAVLMRSAFENASVGKDAVAALEGSMTDRGDRHVLAAAVAGGAEAIITFNLDHFPREACEPFGVEPTHPGEFLLALYGIAPELVVEEVRRQAADLTNPPWSFEDLIEARERAGVERFADALRTPLASEADDPRG